MCVCADARNSSSLLSERLRVYFRKLSFVHEHNRLNSCGYVLLNKLLRQYCLAVFFIKFYKHLEIQSKPFWGSKNKRVVDGCVPVFIVKHSVCIHIHFIQYQLAWYARMSSLILPLLLTTNHISLIKQGKSISKKRTTPNILTHSLAFQQKWEIYFQTTT